MVSPCPASSVGASMPRIDLGGRHTIDSAPVRRRTRASFASGDASTAATNVSSHFCRAFARVCAV